MMRKLIYLFFVPLCCYSVKAQNLVPNGSFEEYYQLPTTQGQIYFCKNWNTATISTPDYFNSYSDNNSGFSVPNNMVGYQEAFDGNAYCGIFLYNKNDTSAEYIETKLIEPLIAEKCYTLSFNISLADSISWYAINNIGAYFSADSIYINQFVRLHQFTPQINNPSTNFLSNKLGWMKISGYFFSQGGEQYLTIGNFSKKIDDDTIRIGGSKQFPSSASYVYIDSVTVRRCGETATEESVAEKIKVYPNPANTYLTANIGKLQNAQVELFDISGRKLLQQSIASDNEIIDVSSFSNGVYICTITSNNQVVKREKIIISR